MVEFSTSEHHKNRPHLVLEKDTSPTEITPTKIFQSSRQTFTKSQEEKSNRKGQEKTTLEEPPLHSTKEGFGRGTTDIRFVSSKQLHYMSKLQNAYDEGGKTPTTQRLLDGFAGFKGWILACTHRTQLPPLPGFPLQGPRLAIQSNAFWPQYSPSHFHKGGLTCSQAPIRTRNLVSALSRRPTNHSKVKGGLPQGLQANSGSINVSGLDHQCQEISPDSRPTLRMARSPIRPETTHSASTQRKARSYSDYSINLDNLRNLLNTGSHEATRPPKLGRSSAPINQRSNVHHKIYYQAIQKISFRPPGPTGLLHETQSMQVVHTSSNSSIPGQPHTRSNYNDRRQSTGLGIPSQRNFIPGHLRQVNVVLHKRLGANHSMVCTTDGSEERNLCTNHVRQLYSSRCSQERDFVLTSLVRRCTTHMEESRVLPVGVENLPHKRELQRNSRPIVSESDNIYGVVPTKEGLQEDSRIESQSSGGFIRHEPQQQAQHIRLPLPRQQSSGSGLSNSTMGQVGASISLPTDYLDFEGFGEDAAVRIHLRNFNYARNANKTLVYGSATTEYSVHSSTDYSPTEGGRKAGQNEPTFCTSRLEVLRGSYAERFSQCNQETLDLMSKPISSSSLRDYQHKWEYFIKFLTNSHVTPKDLNLSHVLSFLTFLFYERRLRPRTVTCYRSAIAEPLLHGFNIDTNTREVYNLIRGMKIQRPAPPFIQPTWRLSKVLSYIEGLKEPISDLWALRKTAFLLNLATAYRVSELHACVRDKDLCFFKPDRSLMIRPHSSFLAKNECPQKRWSHKEIRPLLAQEGKVNKLCPVKALKNYLQRTSRIKTGKLFRSPDLKMKELSKFQLSKHICALVLAADPHTKARVHDVRKLATSASLAKTMLTDDLIKEVGWSSSSTFFRHYLVQTEDIPMEVSLPLN